MVRSNLFSGSLKAMLRLSLALPAAALLVNMSGSAAQAGILFNFNSSSLYDTSGKDPNGIGDNSAIQHYMEGASLLDTAVTGWTVSVSGAQSSGSPTNPGYDADGHVVCAGNTYKKNCIPDTLSTKYDTPYIMTSGQYQMPKGSQDAGNNAIKMVFGGGVGVVSLSFDFEIMPNLDCANGSSRECDNPNFTFLMTDAAGTVEDVTVDAVEPGGSSINCPDIGKYSPESGKSVETADQCMGSMSFTFASTIVDPTLEFIDWPATLAVTNIDWGLPDPDPDPVPEPSSILLLGAGLVGLRLFRRRATS
jgi:hypothetical protein